MTLLYAKEFHMLEGLNDKELENYLEENPQIVPLFDIDIIEMAGLTFTTPTTARDEDYESDTEALMELHRAQDAF